MQDVEIARPIQLGFGTPVGNQRTQRKDRQGFAGRGVREPNMKCDLLELVGLLQHVPAKFRGGSLLVRLGGHAQPRFAPPAS